MTTREAIDILTRFKTQLDRLYKGDIPSSLRSEINQSIPTVDKIVRDTGTTRLMTIAPPPMIGGYVMHNVNPLSMLFNAPYDLYYEILGTCGDMIDSAIGVLKADDKFYERKAKPAVNTQIKDNPKNKFSNRVFVVHGRNNEVKEASARFLEKAGLEPIILHEQPSKGNTIIEKFEEYSDVAFAIVLMTPDDVGGLYGGETKPRARQNVVFELGYFIGKLGRNKVVALVSENVEIPTDISGVVYIGIDGNGFWKIALAKELKSAGYAIDMNIIL